MKFPIRLIAIGLGIGLSGLAQAEQMSATTVWFGSPGFQSSYDKQAKALIATEMEKVDKGFYAAPVYKSTTIGPIILGPYTDFSFSEIHADYLSTTICNEITSQNSTTTWGLNISADLAAPSCGSDRGPIR